MNAVQERIEKNIERIPETGCWIWMGALRGKGYGSIKIAGISKSVHRVNFEILSGAIPEGLQLDHLCRVPCCCNPAHLEPVTCKENVLRGELRNVQRKRMLSKTHCANGHPLEYPHLYIRADGRRQCKTCSADKTRISRAKKRGLKNVMA